MQMPGMDGIETIKAARQIAPHTSFLMLTGNQDVTTALQAVNDGEVFRFLTKPCEIDEIKKALRSAQQQFEHVSTEKELLHETFVGTIGFMSDIVELQSSASVDADRFSNTLTQLALDLDLPFGWEERIAARVALVGQSLLTSAERLKLQTLDIADPNHLATLANLCMLSARMIERIPRLERIAKILRHVPEVDGWIAVSQSLDSISATLLRVAIYWSLLTQKGLPLNTALQEIKLAMPRVSDGLCKAIENLDDYTDKCVPIEISVDQLAEGMVMFEDVTHTDGAIIVSRGRKLTPPIIEKLVRFCSGDGAEVKIVAGSCPHLLAQS